MINTATTAAAVAAGAETPIASIGSSAVAEFINCSAEPVRVRMRTFLLADSAAFGDVSTELQTFATLVTGTQSTRSVCWFKDK